MTCREFIEFLDKYVSGELPAKARAVFDAHIEMCPWCIAYLNSYLTTIEIGKACLAGPEQPLPDEVPEELVQAILGARERLLQ